jgi:mono/diheme cytochrome c family protein
MTPTSFVSAAIIVFTSLLAGVSATAGAQKDDPKSTVDRIYSVAQAERGEQRFKTSCSSCHTPSSFGGGSFADRWSGQSMAEVFDFVSNTMPENDPGGLTKQEYADVLAYILSINGYPVGTDELPADGDALKKFAVVPNGK